MLFYWEGIAFLTVHQIKCTITVPLVEDVQDTLVYSELLIVVVLDVC
jgi:hypothetical protein